jgi:hypothetical protein
MTIIIITIIIGIGTIYAILYWILKDSEKTPVIKEDGLLDSYISQDPIMKEVEQYIKDFGYKPTTVLCTGDREYKIYVADTRIDHIEYEKSIWNTDNFTMYAFIGHNNHSLRINQLIDLNDLSGVLISSVNLVNEVDNRFNIKGIEYACYSVFNATFNKDGLTIETDTLSFRYKDDILTIDNDLIEVNKQYHPNNFEYYMKEFNKRVEFFYEDVAEYVNETKRINGYQLYFIKDMIIADKSFNKFIITYKFKINAYKGTIDIYRDSTHLETNYITDLNDINSVVTSYLDKKPKHTTVDIKML